MPLLRRGMTIAILARRASARRALTLMELLAVVAVIGVLVSMSLPYFGHDSLANASARSFARKLSLDAIYMRRRAISTGDNHLLKFTMNGSVATDYGLYHDQSGTDVIIDGVRPVPDGVSVTPNVSEFEFTFTGEAVATYSATVDSVDRNFVVAIPATTGRAWVQEL